MNRMSNPMGFALTESSVSVDVEAEMAAITKTFFDNGYMTTVQYDRMVELGAEGYLYLLNRLVEVREQNELLQTQADWQHSHMLALREDKVVLSQRVVTAEQMIAKIAKYRERTLMIRDAIHVLATEAQKSHSPRISATGAILATTIEDLFE